MEDLRTTRTFSELVGRIYDAAVEPTRWPAALDAVRCALGFHHAVLALHDLPDGRVRLDHAANLGPAALERMHRHEPHAVALWGGLEYINSHPVREPAVLSRVNPAGLRDAANPWLAEWAAPLGLVDFLALVFARDGTAVGCVGMGRHRDQGPIAAHEEAAARLLVPHLQRAGAIGRLLDEHQATAGRLAAALDQLAAPVLLLAETAAVLHANAAARDLLARDTPLTVRDGRLASPVRGVARAVHEALARCARGDGADAVAGRGFGIPARVEPDRETGRRGSAELFALHVLPLGRGGVRRPPVRGAVAALFVATPRARSGRADDLVAALYGLTPAEARVFALVADGRAPAEAAAVLGIAPSTLRTHLLRVFDKLGVHRQGDLVRLAAALDVPVGAGRGPAVRAPVTGD